MVAATCRQGTLCPVVSGIVALVNSHKEVIRAQGLQRGPSSDAWRWSDAPFLLEFLCEVCENKVGFKCRSFQVLRAMEREAARSIQRSWRRRREEKIIEKEPLHIENVEDGDKLEPEPRVQILILGAPEDATTAVHLDLEAELKEFKKMPEIDPRKSLQASPKKPTAVKPPVETTTGRPSGQAGQASRAVQAAAVPSQVDVPPVEMEDPGVTEKVSELQDLWLQLQEGQRLWRQTTGHEARPAPKASPQRSVAPAQAKNNISLPQGDEPLNVAPEGESPMNPAPPGLELKSRNEYRRKWNPRIAAQQRKEREKLLPNVQRLPSLEVPKQPELVEREVKHCSHEDPMASECGSMANAGFSLSAPMDRGPELYGEGFLSGGHDTSRFQASAEDSDDDVQILRQKIVEMTKITAEVDPSEHGAQSAGISLGAPEPPRRMAELRAAAERRLRSNKEPVQESLADLVPTKQREHRSELGRQKHRHNDTWGRSRTPDSPRAVTPRGSATRTPTPRGAAYKPKHLYSSRAE